MQLLFLQLQLYDTLGNPWFSGHFLQLSSYGKKQEGASAMKIQVEQDCKVSLQYLRSDQNL